MELFGSELSLHGASQIHLDRRLGIPKVFGFAVLARRPSETTVDDPQREVRSHFPYRGSIMIPFVSSIKRFLVSEDGPTAVEYAVMLALIIVVCLTAIQAVGTNASTTFTNVSTQLGGS
jgi:pilus assembly protein Flp/PilA